METPISITNLISLWLSTAKLFRINALVCAKYAKQTAMTMPEKAMEFDYEYKEAVNDCRQCLEMARTLNMGRKSNGAKYRP